MLLLIKGICVRKCKCVSKCWKYVHAPYHFLTLFLTRQLVCLLVNLWYRQPNITTINTIIMPFQVIATVVRRATSSENEVIYHYLGFHISFDQQVSIEELLDFGLAKLPSNYFTKKFCRFMKRCIYAVCGKDVETFWCHIEGC